MEKITMQIQCISLEWRQEGCSGQGIMVHNLIVHMFHVRIYIPVHAHVHIRTCIFIHGACSCDHFLLCFPHTSWWIANPTHIVFGHVSDCYVLPLVKGKKREGGGGYYLYTEWVN